MLPAQLSAAHRHDIGSSALLFLAALLSIPACGLAALSYSRWSRSGTLGCCAGLTVAGLVTLAATGAGGPWPLVMLSVGLLLTGTSGVIAVLGPYTAELYPTRVRGTASGLIAGMSKSGGAFGPPLIALLLGLPGGLRGAALLVTVPIAAAAVASRSLLRAG